MTLSIMTLSITTLSIMTLSIMTLSIMTLSIVKLSITMKNTSLIKMAFNIAHAECRLCLVSFMLSVGNKLIMLSFVIPSVVAPFIEPV